MNDTLHGVFAWIREDYTSNRLRFGFEVLAWNRSQEPRNEFDKFIAKEKSKTFVEISDLVSQMANQPRIFWLMLPHETVSDFLKNQLHV